MRISAVLWLLVLIPCSGAHGSEISSLRVVEAGIYTARTVKDAGDAGPEIVASIRLLKSTTIIPARKGIRFGFRYFIVGEPYGQKIELGMVTVFPPDRRTPDSQANPLQSVTAVHRIVGKMAFRGYHFDQDREILPGR